MEVDPGGRSAHGCEWASTLGAHGLPLDQPGEVANAVPIVSQFTRSVERITGNRDPVEYA
ncbi:MAG TPA: hypothetical protein VHJ39_14245 [Solirubrobacteraceae bacterium]|nr:hypothetical protein [Solirubrobacteraceae bacterium]